MPTADVRERVRSIALGFPGVEEKLSHGAPAFFVKKQFLMVWDNGHHDHEFPHLWCAAEPGVQEALVASSTGRVFRPPYVGHRGWLGVRLDGDVDWQELAELIEDAYRAVAPKRLIAELDAS
jgi:hypothetical protein